ncbi:DUF2188 domain-containing protein [Nesterenkonia sp. MY13]|uniref:DUF2188 domain-containing protein n=1 Tax=Nesterenkonia sedimenti TaxID=1463632 RepID=A0A7X8TMM4_9MICC|nr:DUF2188 domain-containing protein [Nesterenkonia sedimenti]NLS11237.1 DUF2188 domain-containing protein [Nesterenkonia sedimenti]
MPRGDVETYHQDGQWHSRIEGEGSAPFHTSETKFDEVGAGRDEARRRKVEHIIKNLDGTIGQRNSYGHDPRDVPG